MVHCQPRQLVICSLPFAALVAFFWFKRRKSLSRSDPGGTLGIEPRVDQTHKSGAENAVYKESGGQSTEEDIPAPPKVEDFCVASTVNSLKLEKVIAEKPIFSTVFEKSAESIPKIKENIACNNIAVEIKDNLDICKESEEEINCNTPEFETNLIFHSTVIGEDKLERDNIVQEDKPVEIPVEHSTVIEAETVNLKKTVSKDKLEQKSETVPIDEQSTIENIALRNQTSAQDKLDYSQSEQKSVEPKIPLENTKEIDLGEETFICDKKADTTEVLESSSDSGIQEPPLSKDSSMAQGHKTEEKNDDATAAAGLEQKLASLGLDTAQQTPRTERDSANHSPAEVMLNSPAISTYSDAHSEVVKWLIQCDRPVSCGKSLICRQKCEKRKHFPDPDLLIPVSVHQFYPPDCQNSTLDLNIITDGSSDSGKGCSDVVTPPSRTPAGGSSVAGDQVPSIFEFVLPQVIVGRLIGRHGSFLHDIRAKTHTNVFIKRHPETNTLKICAVEGTQQDIDAALKMIRQKFPLRRFPELTLERVSFVRNTPCPPINPENLQLHLVEGVNNDVLLCSLITPGQFFLHLPMHMSYHSLYRLACIMNSVYNTQESPCLQDPQPDVVCVAPSHSSWYRVQIITIDKENDTSFVKFLDYGGYLTVENSVLRQIRGDFLLLPFQAVECSLANVVPAGGEEEWSEEAKMFMQQMTLNQTLQAQVYDYTEAGLPLVYLYCTHFYHSPADLTVLEPKVVLLNHELVSRGYAELIDSTQEDGHTSATESS